MKTKMSNLSIFIIFFKLLAFNFKLNDYKVGLISSIEILPKGEGLKGFIFFWVNYNNPI